MSDARSRAMLKKWLLLSVLAIIATATAGCPLLLIPSLGYEAYEYKKTGTLPGMPPRPHKSPTPPSDQIE